MKLNLKDVITVGIFAALTAILSQLSFKSPFSPVSITLQTFAVFLTAVILGSRNGTISQIVYILLGIFGVPVFANFRGGLDVIMGPSGGYIISFPIAVLVIGLFMERKPDIQVIGLAFLMTAGTVIVYTVGTVWLAAVLKVSLSKALWLGVIPFIPFDIVKIAAAAVIGSRVRKALLKAGLLHIRPAAD
jgi:biotin transport system substrate-specific component